MRIPILLKVGYFIDFYDKIEVLCLLQHFNGMPSANSTCNMQATQAPYRILHSFPHLFQMPIISIPDYSDKNGAIFYRVHAKLPLRSIIVHKRYTDFVTLVEDLSEELGLSSNDFPYKLPSKATLFSNKKKVAECRKIQLCNFLNEVVMDRDLQNRKIFHQFLQLPNNFKFTKDLLGKESIDDNDDRFLIDQSISSIEKDQWLAYFRIVRSSVNKLDKGVAISEHANTREMLLKYIRPNMDKLAKSLTNLSFSGAIDSHEFHSRETKLAQLHNDIESLLTNKDDLFRESAKSQDLFGRVFGRPQNGSPKETDDTIALDNRGLLQQQQQIHLEQDKEIEQLRKIIARQKQIGQAINSEVEEQNEMLDRFSDEVDLTSQKLQTARQKAKKIT